MNQKLNPRLPYLSIPLIILLAVLLVSIANPPPLYYVSSNYGKFDLRGMDFENYVALLGGVVEYIPGVLLNPDEFDAWENETLFGGVSPYSFSTSRIRIYVEDGKWYTFFRNSTDYSHRMYVNGEWLLDIGKPGETSETDIPNTGRITFTAQGVDGVIEIVQQSSNHVHRSGGGHLWWFVGTGTLLSDWTRAEQYQTSIILGSFLVLALLFLMLFFTHRRNFANLFFAIFCFVWFMRMGVTGGRVFTVIIPWLDWFWKFRIEYIAIPLSAILTLAIANIIFRNALHKTVLKIFYGISGAFILLFLFLDTVVMRDWLDILFYIYGAAILWLFGCLIFRQKVYSTEQKMFGAGLILFIVAAVVDLGYVTAFFYMPNFHMTGVAVLVFALCEASAVFTATMKQQQYLEAEKSALESLSRMKSKYLADMSHETKTPLSAMALHIQQAEILYKDENGQNQTIINSLQRAQEIIKRVTRLSENARNLASMQENKERMKPIPTAEFLRDSTEHYKALLKNTVLTLEISDRLPPILGNKGELEQVITNLLTNAGEYTKNGKITVRGEFAEQFVIISVTDSGTGIDPVLLPRIFERGVLGENSTGMGIGLAICKDFIENHGGAITAESEPGKGTTISFTLPAYKQEGKNE